MSHPLLLAAALVLAAGAVAPVEGADGGLTLTADQVRADLAARVRGMDRDTWPVVGERPWLFWSMELLHYSHGEFWGRAAARAAMSATDPDPLKAIVAYDRMLRSVGVQLVVVPIPGKVVLYGEKLAPPIRADLLRESRAAFLAALAERGVRAIDVLPDFDEVKAAGHLAYLPRDTHWTSEVMHRAAARIARSIKRQKWYAPPAPRPRVTIEAVTEDSFEDLDAHRALDDLHRSPQTLPVRVLQVRLDGSYVESDPGSPVVLVGDSYTVAFHSLLGHHGGLADHLAAELGYPVDQVGLAGMGAIANSWGTLARRKDNLAGKKVVVLAFGERNLTCEPAGWPIIPVVRLDAGAPP